MAEKEQHRSSLRALRDQIDDADARAGAEAAAARALEILPAADELTVGIYAAVSSELRTAPLCGLLEDRGARLAFPRVVPNDLVLEFYAASLADLVAGFRGIPEPDPSAHQLLRPGEIDMFIIPGLAFDRSGARLGWGRGYYDATLAHHAATLRVGFAYELQVLASVPTDSLDELMDWLVTPSYAHQCPARPSAPPGRSKP